VGDDRTESACTYRGVHQTKKNVHHIIIIIDSLITTMMRLNCNALPSTKTLKKELVHNNMISILPKTLGVGEKA
jgi:hypothetical protein